MLDKFLYKLKRPYHFIKTGLFDGLPSQIKYGQPQKKIKTLIITGTDGKTTTASLLYHLLKTAGLKVALNSTVAAYLGEKKIPTGYHVTAPLPHQIYELMAQMVKNNYEYLVLEFTSHGAYQYRNWGIKPKMTGLTNITHEHLDYHLNLDNYIEAKALLFKNAQVAFLNKDDHYYHRCHKKINPLVDKIEPYSLKNKLNTKIRQTINQNFFEKYNQSNAVLASMMARALGIKINHVCEGLKTFQGVPGRMQLVKSKKPYQVVIDFAHTPNALESVLQALRKRMNHYKMSGRLIAVFGCAGARDRKKRPIMGKLAASLADLSIFTAEDPRNEDIWSIIRQMKQNLDYNYDKIMSIADRAHAIDFAINKLAKKGDMIAILGKGPEKTMCFGKKEIPWSDLKQVKKSLKN